MEYICYHWTYGAFLSGLDHRFEESLISLIKQFGPPSRISRSRLNRLF